MKDIVIDGLGSTQLTMVNDGDTTYVIASMPNDKAEHGTLVSVVALDTGGMDLLREFVKEVTK